METFWIMIGSEGAAGAGFGRRKSERGARERGEKRDVYIYVRREREGRPVKRVKGKGRDRYEVGRALWGLRRIPPLLPRKGESGWVWDTAGKPTRVTSQLH
ncbi:hypothetical protein TIFTF001_004730 [Ficus carica]|uniref:Uncharacterized protein n=1 Tax=Ficus carica TaxID=3494 RepID=A0AA87ZDZ9_FICCA|nr:hypothetical protein TIFTF001_004730 [Ficus carica]